ncbi:chorismate mutase [Hathewaya massiliensis]|uniref:chorismate mutase n=1 Tax=Hathewaya massiliensis TaxID=1964382 RepID=UPI0011574E20|nr:chorismate mutase [Hathewaya massiliensis]
MENINNIRREIDLIDEELVKLFEKRLELALKVSEYKKEKSLPIFDSNRETEVINKAKSRLNNPQFEIYLEEFFTDIMEISKKLQYHNSKNK